MTATAGVWAGVLRWAADAPVEVNSVDAGGGGWDWVPIVAAFISALSLLTTFLVGRKSLKAAQASVRVAVRQTELQDESARAAIAESRRATQVAIEQTELQRANAEEARAAVVWADVRPHPDSPDFLYLSVGNTGSSVARDVRVRIEPPIEGPPKSPERALEVQDAARNGIASLVPGRTYEWRLGNAREIIEANLNHPGVDLVITWVDGNGAHHGETFPVRVTDVWMTAIVTKGSLRDVANAIKKMK